MIALKLMAVGFLMALMYGLVLAAQALTPVPNIGAKVGATETKVLEPHWTFRHPECLPDKQQALNKPDQIKWHGVAEDPCRLYGEFEGGDPTSPLLIVAVISGGVLLVLTAFRRKNPREYCEKRGEHWKE